MTDVQVVAGVLANLKNKDDFGRVTYESDKYGTTGMIEQIAKQADE